MEDIKCNFCGSEIDRINYRKAGDYYFCINCGNTDFELEKLKEIIGKKLEK